MEPFPPGKGVKRRTYAGWRESVKLKGKWFRVRRLVAELTEPRKVGDCDAKHRT